MSNYVVIETVLINELELLVEFKNLKWSIINTIEGKFNKCILQQTTIELDLWLEIWKSYNNQVNNGINYVDGNNPQEFATIYEVRRVEI